MARIKVTGYLDTDDLDPEQVDLSHEMGLTEHGYDGKFPVFSSILEDVEFELVKE